MKPLSQIDMAEATCLTVEGKLDEAMAMLRGAIRSTSAPATSSEAEFRRQPAPPPRAAEFVDLVPPSAATGDCWTSPRHAPTDRGSKSPPPELTLTLDTRLTRNIYGFFRGCTHGPNQRADEQLSCRRSTV